MLSWPLCVTFAVHLWFALADKNFELLFKTNSETYINLPVRSVSPLPSWLLGEYVSERERQRERFFHKGYLNYSIYISALAQEPYCSLPCLKRGSPNIDQAVTMSFTKVCVRACVCVCFFVCAFVYVGT